MTRMLAFVAALLMTAISVSSACVASNIAPLQFTIEPTGNGERLQLHFRRADTRGTSIWSNSYRPGELSGLDALSLRAPGARPVRFWIAREAGRIDCAGNGGDSRAIGTCSVAPDPRFLQFLGANGIARPTPDQTHGLIAIDVRRGLVTGLKAANYPTPSIDKLIELSAVGVSPAYIRELAAHGYRPRSLQELVEFRAMNITPQFIASFSRAGYANLAPGDLVQLKAMDITPEFIAGFERIGYRNLPVDTLVQLKAMNVTPEFVRAVQKGDTLPSPDRLVQIRAVSQGIRNR